MQLSDHVVEGVKGQTVSYAYNSEGYLVQAGNEKFSYDPAGNLVSKTAPGRTYKYDEENRLIEVRANGSIIRYTYDGEGNRVQRESNGQVVHYLYHRLTSLPQVMAEYDESGKLLRHHLLGPSRIALRDASGQTIWLLEDRLGSTRIVVDAVGKVLARYAYPSPFGMPTLTEGTPQTDFLFTGEQCDSAAQLLYLRARYYDPQTGRFLSVDPLPGLLSDPQSFNRYVYASNDPVNRVDPTGMQSWWLPPPPPPPPFFDLNRDLLRFLQERPSWQLFSPPPRLPLISDPFQPSFQRSWNQTRQEGYFSGYRPFDSSTYNNLLRSSSPVLPIQSEREKYGLAGAQTILNIGGLVAGGWPGWCLAACGAAMDLYEWRYAEKIGISEIAKVGINFVPGTASNVGQLLFDIPEDGHSILFDPIKMRVKTETMRWQGGKLVPAGNIKDPHAEAFAEHFSTHYEEFARENPVFAELKVVTQAVALAKWMKEQGGIPVDWNFVRLFAQPHETPTTTPAAYAEQKKEMSSGRAVGTLTVRAFGGVDMNPQISVRAGKEGTAFSESLNKAWTAAKQQGEDSFAVEFNQKQYQAVALPPSPQQEVASYSLAETALAVTVDAMEGLPGLTRFYNSFHNEPTEFGSSWSLLLPRLHFESTGEKGHSEYMAVQGNPATRVKLQKFTLMNPFGAQERFVGHFIDQGLGRIGFRTESQSSAFRGLYPEDSLYRLIFANTEHQALFDSEGNLRAMLTPKGKALYDYDSSGRLSIIRFSRKDQEEKVRFEYDAQGCIGAVATERGRIVYEYDQAGNLGAVRSGEKVTTYRYDDRHLLTEITVGGKTVVHNGYDQTGHLVEQRDLREKQRQQRVEPTAEGGKVVTLQNGNDTVKRYYDAQLRLTKVASAGGLYRCSHGGDGQVTLDATLSGGSQVKVEFSPDGKVKATQDSRGVRTDYRFYEDGKLAEVLVDQQRLASYRYDDQGRVAEVVYEGGAADLYAYDAAGRVSQYRRVLTGNQKERVESVSLHYDPQGNLDSVRGSSLGQIHFVKQQGMLTAMRGKAAATYRYTAPTDALSQLKGRKTAKMNITTAMMEP